MNRRRCHYLVIKITHGNISLSCYFLCGGNQNPQLSIKFSQMTSSRFASLFNQFKRMNLPWRSHRFAGEDKLGNLYFEGKQVKAGYRRTQRWVDFNDGQDHHYDSNQRIPVQWQSWLRHTRDDGASRRRKRSWTKGTTVQTTVLYTHD